jgi:hypothetical protein
MYFDLDHQGREFTRRNFLFALPEIANNNQITTLIFAKFFFDQNLPIFPQILLSLGEIRKKNEDLNPFEK